MTTVADVFDAIEKNGLPKTKDAYFEFDYHSTISNRKETITAACALGQAAYNLNLGPSTLYYRLDYVRPGLASRITFLNDKTRYGFKRIAKILREEYKDILDKELNPVALLSLDVYFS